MSRDFYNGGLWKTFTSLGPRVRLISKQQLSQLIREKWWLSGGVLDPKSRGRGFETHWRHCVVSSTRPRHLIPVSAWPKSVDWDVNHQQNQQTNGLPSCDLGFAIDARHDCLWWSNFPICSDILSDTTCKRERNKDKNHESSKYISSILRRKSLVSIYVFSENQQYCIYHCHFLHELYYRNFTFTCSLRDK